MQLPNIDLHNVVELLQGTWCDILPPDGLASLQNWTAAVHLSEYLDLADREGLWVTRLPDDVRRAINEDAQWTSLAGAGVELRFNLRAAAGQVVFKCALGSAVADVYQGSFFVGHHVIGPQATAIPVALPANTDELCRLWEEHSLPFDPRLTRILLPYHPMVKLLGLELDAEPPRHGQTPATTLLIYGSSITHGSLGVTPHGLYAQRTARLLSMDLLNLGCGGGARVEPEVAAHIAARQDWDAAVLEIGINCVDWMDIEEFKHRVPVFIGQIVAAHPNKPVFVIDMFTYYGDVRADPRAEAFRGVVRQAVAQAQGQYPRLHHVSGRELLRSVDGLAADVLHPGPDGMEEIAQNLAAFVRGRM
jgi:hypothetical protein